MQADPETQSQELENYDLSYSYDDNLNELPKKPEDMKAYADLLVARSKLEMKKPEPKRNWSEIAKAQGMAGSLRKITGQFAEAEKLLQSALKIINEKALPATLHVQQSIRLCDVWKRLGQYDKALQGLADLVAQCTQDKAVNRYLDTALQHEGKVQFCMGDYKTALQSFQKALELRRKKKDRDLIESSETAIEACRRRLA